MKIETKKNVYLNTKAIMKVTKRIFSLIFLISNFSLSMACGQKEKEEVEDTEEAPPSGSTNQNSGDVPIPEAPQGILDLFQDSSSISPSSLASASTDCLEIDSQASFSNAVEPWPKELKSFLAAELAKFPQMDLLTGAVAGIFLAKPEMLSAPDSSGLGTVAGIMCNAEGEKRGYVFINYEQYVTVRQTSGQLQSYQNLVGLVDPYVLTEHGDQAIFTLIHEIFHAIDRAYFGETDGDVVGRASVYDLSWNSSGESLDERAEIFGLTSAMSRHICSSRGFNLSPGTPDEMAEAYRKIAEDTNFISPYAQVNSFEDFADTLATWYFRVIYDNGLSRSVYRDDLTNTPLETSQLIYKFDTKKILEDSTRHREKMCKMVDVVFDGIDCAI
jgi:hypothetical protein